MFYENNHKIIVVGVLTMTMSFFTICFVFWLLLWDPVSQYALSIAVRYLIVTLP